MPWTPSPRAGDASALEVVDEVLGPVLRPLGFAAGQSGAGPGHGQVIFCRGPVDSVDGGCVDLVVDLAAEPEWHVTGVRYWGFPSDRWQLAYVRDEPLQAQLADLARTLPGQLAPEGDGSPHGR